MYTVAGTQAENTIDNHIVVSKMYSMYKTQYDDDPEEAEPEELAGVLLFPQAARLAVRARARIRVKNFFIFQYFLLFRFAAERRIYGSIRKDLSRRTSARIAPPPGNVNDFSHVIA